MTTNLKTRISDTNWLPLTKDDMLRNYRAVFAEGRTEGPSTLTDTIIWSLHEQVLANEDAEAPDTAEGWDELELAVTAAMERAETEIDTGKHKEIAAAGRQANAYTWAESLAKDAQFNADLEAITEAKGVVSRGPITVLLDLERIKSADELNAAPIPGTGKKKKGVAHVKGNNDDYYDTLIKTDKGTRIGQQSWWYDVADALPGGKAVAAELAAIKQAMDAVNPQDKPAQYRSASKAELVGAKLAANSRLTVIRSNLTKAVRVRALMARINAEMPRVVAEVRTYEMPDPTDKTKVVQRLKKTLTPMFVAERHKRENGQEMSVSQFLGIDVDTALEKGGTYTNLLETLKREGDSGQGGEGDTAQSIDNLPTFISTTSMLLHYIEEHKAAINAGLTKGKEREELLLGMGDLYGMLDGIMGKYTDAYERLAAKREQETEALNAKPADTKAA